MPLTDAITSPAFKSARAAGESAVTDATRTPSFARLGPHCSQRLWPDRIGGALSPVDDALDFALAIARDATKPFPDPAADIPGRASHSMFVHCILLHESKIFHPSKH